MISHKYNLIYIHIPKTGGLSVCDAFDSKEQNHKGLNYYIENYGCSHYFKFTIVRNPWDRFLSTYFYLKNGNRVLEAIKRGNNHIKHLHDHINKFKDFKDFCIYSKDIPNIIKHDIHFKPQISFFTDVPFDYVGFFETLNSDIKEICKINNISNINISHLNKSDHLEYWKYYNNELKDIVYNLYKDDILKFNYNFK